MLRPFNICYQDLSKRRKESCTFCDHFDESAKAGLASANPSVRKGTLVMLEQQYDLKAAKALADYASDVSNPAAERAMAVTYLAEVHRKIPPWDGSWWGTRPTRGIIPAKVDSWEGTDFVLSQIRNRLADPTAQIRLASISTVTETKDKQAIEILRANLRAEKDKTSFKLKANSEKTDKLSNNLQAEKDKSSFEFEADSEKTDKLSNDLEAEIKTLDNRLRMSIHDLIDSVVFPNFWRFPGTYFAKVQKNILNFF